MVDCRPNDQTWHDMNRVFNRFVAGYVGRPLLNQTKQIDRPVTNMLDAAWQAAWKNLGTKARAEPRFLNSFFDALLP